MPSADQKHHENSEFEVIWGVDAIASAIRRTPRQTHYLLTKGAIPGEKVGGRWACTRSALRSYFEALSTKKVA